MSGIHKLDLELFTILNGVPHPEWLDWLFWVITSLGLGWIQAPAILLATLLWWRGNGALLASVAARRLLWPGLWSFACSGLMTQGLKRVVERPRPPDLGYKALDEAIQAYSFPSGHTSTSFAIAYVVWSLTRKTRHAWVGWTAWLLALMVGYSRIYRGVHYPFDVLGGALLGTMTGIAMVWFFRKRYGASENSA